MKTHIIAAATAALLATAAPTPSHLSLAPTPALAQAALTFENLGFKGEFGAVRIPKISIEGSTASRADIEGLFDPNGTATVADRLKRISASSITIPAIEIEQKLPDSTSFVTYRDTVIRDVRNGIIGEMVTPVMTMKATVKGDGPKTHPMDVSATNMTMKEVDLGLMLTALFGKGAADQPLQVAAKEQSVGRMTMKIGDQMNMVIAGASIRDFKMRISPKSLMEVMTEVQKNEADKVPDLEKKNAALMTPIFKSMALGTVEMTGMTISTKAEGSKPALAFNLDKISMAAPDSIIPEMMRIQGMRISEIGVTVNIAELMLDKMDFSASMAAVDRVNSGGGQPAVEDLLPKIGLFRLAGLDFDVPDSKSPNQRVKGKLGLFETRMSNHVGPIPADVKMTLDRFQMDIPPNTKEKGLQDILALGYKALDISMGYDMAWLEASKTLRLNDLSMKSAGMFTANAKAEIGNVTRDLFTLDQAKAMVAGLGVAAKSVEVAIVNDTLFQRLIEKQAKETRRKPDEVRAEFAAGATMMAPMFMGDHAAARMIGQVLGKFVADPKNIKMTLTSKDGVGAADFIAAKNPLDVLKKVDIKAGANE
jgi:hypothetical protein